MTIVCATDFSEGSFSAVRVAATLAHRHQQPLWLVNVMPERMVTSPGAKRALAASEALLLEAAALASEQIEVKTAVLRGPLARTVGQFCAEKGALLLVVGDSNHHSYPLLPSPLDKFAYGVETPLLVVRDPSRSAPGRWAPRR